MAENNKIELYPEVVEAPRFTCALGGAYASALATYGTVPILHSGAGCGMANAHGMTFASGLNTGGAQGTTSTPCSCLIEEHVIFGGEGKLRKLIKSTIELMKGDLFAVISGCVPSLIGDDVDSVIKEFSDQVPIIHINGAGFVGSSYHGYELFLEAVIDQLLTDLPKEKKLVNIFGIVPNQHVFWKGDLEVIKSLLESIGVQVNTIFTDFSGFAALKKIPAAELNLVFSSWVGIKSAQKLKERFNTPYEVISSVPFGPKETSNFLQLVAEKLKIPKRVISKVVEAEEKRAYRFAEYMSELFVVSVPHAFYAVVADSSTAISMIKYGTNELGWNPQVVILTDNPPEEYRAAIVKQLTENLESAYSPKVIFEIDSHRIRLILRENTFQVLLSSSLEKYIAGGELDAIHLGVSFPIYDRAILDRSYAGYRGGLAFIEDLTATYAGPM
ncbi:MAG TPA: nitrogenase component 1 [Desulfosporosinus sp.]|nr:nitrogenase component 1 [Desulfosporosinus sp.]